MALPPTPYPTGELPRLAPAEPFPVAAPRGVGRTMTFQKPAGDDAPAAPAPLTGLSQGKAEPKAEPKAGKTATSPASQTKFEGAVNRSTAFRLQGDAELNRRMVNELIKEANERAKEANERSKQNPKDKIIANAADYNFPEVQQVAPPGTPYVAKTVNYPPGGIFIEPTYVTHRRLYFEDRNTERYGWDLGPLQTVVSAGAFYKDVFLFPAYFASHPHERYETSRGKCRPGDPVPYFLYPPEIDIWGYAAQASTLVGAGFVFPY